MAYKKALIAEKLLQWEKNLREYSLPKWEELPSFELYMDQVVSLLRGYLDFLPEEDAENEKLVTPLAINNYVRLKIMPAPVKKRYSRVHLAYLVMICTLKQSHSIAYVAKMLPSDLTEEQLARRYDEYVETYAEAKKIFSNQIGEISGQIFSDEGEHEPSINRLITIESALAAFSKSMTERVVDICGENEK